MAVVTCFLQHRDRIVRKSIAEREKQRAGVARVIAEFAHETGVLAGREAGIDHQWTTAIHERLWRKLALNCAINPLTVLHACRNGGLQAYAGEVSALCEELIQVLQCCDQPRAAEGLQGQVNQVILATAANYSSMYQDVAQGRRTEIRFLLGYICEAAVRHACHAPQLNRTRVQLIKHLKAKGLPSD